MDDVPRIMELIEEARAIMRSFSSACGVNVSPLTFGNSVHTRMPASSHRS